MKPVHIFNDIQSSNEKNVRYSLENSQESLFENNSSER